MAGRRAGRTLLLGGLLVMCIGLLNIAGVTVRVYDNGGTSNDDVARIWIDGQNMGEISGLYPNPGTNERTWDLGIPSVGLHTLDIEHVADLDAETLCALEVVGTYGIEFGGGGLAASDDSGSVNRGSSVDISVLSNDVYVAAGATATNVIPCPSASPAPTTGCSCTGTTTYSTTFDVSGGSLTINGIVSGPSKGAAQIVGDVIRYTPNLDGCGTDTFTYEVDGPGGSSDTAAVTVTISSPMPSVGDDEAETPEGQAVLIAVLANDSDSGGGPMVLDSVGVPAHGTTTIVGDEIRYTPTARYEGPDRFSYVARDPCGATRIGWVDVDVLRKNHSPTANAGGFYQGIVGEPIELSARFSTDPDLGDRLEYRWDLDDDGRFDTDWLKDDEYSVTYDEAYLGRAVLEVRDLYRGQPAGGSDTDTALIRIDAQQTLQTHVFEDLDGDGVWSAGEPSLPGLDVVIAGETLTTAPDGRVSVELDAGAWDVALTAASVLALESRGFSALVTELTVDLGRGENALAEFAVIKISTRLKGVVYGDVNENGEFDDEDRVAAGLIVILDGDRENAVVTDETGQFSFRDVPFGDHTLLIQEVAEEGAGDPLNLLVPFSLTRAKKPEVFIVWPYDLGPEKGFLQVDVEKGEGGRP